MRSRIVVFVVLAVVTALVGVRRTIDQHPHRRRRTRNRDPSRLTGGTHPAPAIWLGVVALTRALAAEGLAADGRCEPGRHRHPAGPAATDAARVAVAAAQHRPGALRQGDKHAVGQHRPDRHRRE
jgi:hypothetical protein